MIPIMFLVIFFSDILVNKLKKVKTYDSVYGVVTGAFLGIIPQCGIPVGFAELYNKSLIGMAVLITVFLSSSDEAIIVASGHYDIYFIIKLIFTKVIVAILFGLLLHFLFKTSNNGLKTQEVHVICEEISSLRELFLKSLKGTINISIYVFVTVFIINLLIEIIGLEKLHEAIKNMKFFQPVLSSFIGLIPSCASSIFLMEAHMDKILSYGALISGLCANSGYGILVIFRTRPLKESLKLTAILISISIIVGEVIQFIL